MEKTQVFVCSRSKEFMAFVKDLVGNLDYSLRQFQALEEVVALEDDYKPAVLVVDYEEGKDEEYELIIKSTSAHAPGLKIALIYRGTYAGDLYEGLQKNREAIWLQNPFEMEMFLNWLLLVAPVEIPTNQLKLEHLSSVRIADIGPKEKFNFDLYYFMPANNKFILYRRKDSEMSQEQFEKFKNFKIRDLYVRKSELPELQKYLSNRLKRVLKDNNLSESQRREKLKAEAKGVFKTLLGAKPNSAKESRQVLESCKGVALNFIQETSQKPGFYQKLLELTSNGHSNYNHSINVSIYCTLFAMALGEKNLEAAAVGGLLHDIGLSTFDKKLDERQNFDMSDEDFELLESHPEAAVKLLNSKRAITDKDISAMITGHHEHMDGSGYPKGIKEEEISSLARICAIADEFDHLTSVRINQRTLSPHEAIEKMLFENQNPEHPVRYDQKMLLEIHAMFTAPEEKVVTESNVRQLKKASTQSPEVPSEPLPDTQKAAVGEAKKRARRIRPGMKY